MKRRAVSFVSAVLVVLISSLTAFGQVAPITTSDTIGAGGFPAFIQDNAVPPLQLGLCNVDNGTDALGNTLGPCVLEPGVTNYWAADAIVESPDGIQRYLTSMSIAAIVEPGFRLIANEIVVRVRNKNGLAPGAYTVITPYKTYTLVAAAGDRDIRVVDGVETDLALVTLPAPLDGPVQGNLLTTLNDTVNPPPAGFVGTGKELADFHSPLDAAGPNPDGGGLVFRVLGPDGGLLAETNKFSVQGMIFTPTPPDTVTIRSITFNARRGILTIRVASSVRGSTFTATAAQGGTVTVRGGVIRVTGLPPGLNAINVASSGGGTASLQVTIP